MTGAVRQAKNLEFDCRFALHPLPVAPGNNDNIRSQPTSVHSHDAAVKGLYSPSKSNVIWQVMAITERKLRVSERGQNAREVAEMTTYSLFQYIHAQFLSSLGWEAAFDKAEETVEEAKLEGTAAVQISEDKWIDICLV